MLALGFANLNFEAGRLYKSMVKPMEYANIILRLYYINTIKSMQTGDLRVR